MEWEHRRPGPPLECKEAALWEAPPSLLLAPAGGGVLLAAAGAGLPQQERAEHGDDAQVKDKAEDEGAEGAKEGRRQAVGLQPLAPRRHVGEDTLHLEVSSHHGADVEELVTVA